MSNKCPKCKHVNPPGWNFCSNCAYKNTTQATCAYHFVVMGAGGVGKSALTIQFVNRQFEPKYDPTIEDRYQKVLEYKSIPCFLEILDTAGQETFSAMRELYMKNGEGFILVYSITNHRSLEALDAIRGGICRHKNTTDVPMILVGNKCDLENKREVQTSEGKEVAKSWKVPFLEASAKKDLHVQEIFFTLLDLLWDKNGMPKLKAASDKSKRCSIM